MLLGDFGAFQCSEIRHHVYALLSMNTRVRTDQVMAINYDCLLEKLVFDVLLFCEPMDDYVHPMEVCTNLLEVLAVTPRQGLWWASRLQDTDNARFEKLVLRSYQIEFSKRKSLRNGEGEINISEGGIRKFATVDDGHLQIWTRSDAQAGDIFYHALGSHCGRAIGPLYRYGPLLPAADLERSSTDPRQFDSKFIGMAIESYWRSGRHRIEALSRVEYPQLLFAFKEPSILRTIDPSSNVRVSLSCQSSGSELPTISEISDGHMRQSLRSSECHRSRTLEASTCYIGNFELQVGFSQGGERSTVEREIAFLMLPSSFETFI